MECWRAPGIRPSIASPSSLARGAGSVCPSMSRWPTRPFGRNETSQSSFILSTSGERASPEEMPRLEGRAGIPSIDGRGTPCIEVGKSSHKMQGDRATARGASRPLLATVPWPPCKGRQGDRAVAKTLPPQSRLDLMPRAQAGDSRNCLRGTCSARAAKVIMGPRKSLARCRRNPGFELLR